MRYMPGLVGGVFAVSSCKVSRAELGEFAGGDISDTLLVAAAVIALVFFYYLFEMIRISSTDF